MNEQNLRGIGKLSRKRLVAVIRHIKGCLKSENVAECLQISRAAARKILAFWAKSSWVLRIAPGVYLPVELEAESAQDIVIDPWIVATQLYPSCYIGGWSACEYWGFTDQIFNSTVVLTAKQINGKQHTVGKMNFFIKRQNVKKSFGLENVWKETIKVKVSDPHKTIIDILDDPSLAGGIRSAADILQKYLQSKYFDSALLLKYAAEMKNKTIFKRLGYLLSFLKPSETALIKECQKNISLGNSEIDPASKGTRLITKWRLWLPDNIENALLR